MKRKRIGEILIDHGMLRPDELELALGEQKRTGEMLGVILVRLGLVAPNAVARALAEQSDISYLDLRDFQPDQAVLHLVPTEVARAARVVPISREGRTLKVGTASLKETSGLDRLRGCTGLDIEPVLVDPNLLRDAIDTYYPAEDGLEAVVEAALKGEFVSAAEAATDAAPIIKLLDSIIQRAATDRGTDIHIEPDEKVCRIRYRVDGVLRVMTTLPRDVHKSILARLKVMAALDIAQTRMPQDGRFEFKVSGETVHLRLSTYPTANGESAVLRLLMGRAVAADLSSLGLAGKQLDSVESLIRKPYGIVVCCGPTGSGKTTTLYSALLTLSSVDRNIMTVEDPIEYRVPLLKQSQVNDKAGFTFATALAHILRHDPDVILVGEARDEATADLAFQAAMTGHLVFTSVHANTASEVVTRLQGLGIDRQVISSSLLGVIGQRLVRKVCGACTAPDAPPKNVAFPPGVPGAGKDANFQRGKGCRECGFTGYRGRTGIFEVLSVSPEVASAIFQGRPAVEIERLAGYPPMRVDGLVKARAGITTVDEVLRVVR